MNALPSVRNNKICETGREWYGLRRAAREWNAERGSLARHRQTQMTYVLDRTARCTHGWSISTPTCLRITRPGTACRQLNAVHAPTGIADATARHRFTVARGALRTVVAAYARTAPAALRLAVTRRGKPYLVDGPVEFSLTTCCRSRSDCRGARCRGRRCRAAAGRRMDPLRLARRVLHPATVTRCSKQLPADRLEVAFLDAWTQREAHAKALGGGLFHTPDTLPYVAGMTVAIVRHVTDQGGRQRRGAWRASHRTRWRLVQPSSSRGVRVGCSTCSTQTHSWNCEVVT
jgi:hypothetical protein